MTACFADDRDAFEHRLDHARLRSDGTLGAHLLGRLGSDQRDRDDLLLRADRADANVEVTRLAVVEHRGVAVDLAGREHAMHRCERLRMQLGREEFGDGLAFELLRAAPADAAIRKQHAQAAVEHQHVVGNRRDQLAQRLARPGSRGGQVARGGGGGDRGFFRRNAQGACTGAQMTPHGVGALV